MGGVAVEHQVFLASDLVISLCAASDYGSVTPEGISPGTSDTGGWVDRRVNMDVVGKRQSWK
jgi:hypothetical protein